MIKPGYKGKRDTCFELHGQLQKHGVPLVLLICIFICTIFPTQAAPGIISIKAANDQRERAFFRQPSTSVSLKHTAVSVIQSHDNIASLTLQNSKQQSTIARQRQIIQLLAASVILLLILSIVAVGAYLLKSRSCHGLQTLMNDLHHRVKNNLQVLSGLFTMQIESLSDEHAKSILRENEARLTSMNLIHSKLYLNHSTSKIEMSEYLTKLLNHLKTSFDNSFEKGISLKIEVPPIMLEAERAVSIGLIVNELAVNAFKHAFDGHTGQIYLGLKQTGKSKLLLSLGDNGKGLDKNNARESSFGLRLVNLLVKQLNSTMTVSTAAGAFYQIEMRNP